MSVVAKISVITLLLILLMNIIMSMNGLSIIKFPAQIPLYHNIISISLVVLIMVIILRYNLIPNPTVNFQQRY
jgi:hypothetical protein